MINEPVDLLKKRADYANALHSSLEILVSYTEKEFAHVMSNGLWPIAKVAEIDRIVVFRVWSEEQNIAGELQLGLSLWKNFKFLLNLDFNGTSFEDSPLGPLSNLGASIGYKRASLAFRTQSIAGSLEWKGEKAGTGPAGRQSFTTQVTTAEIRFNFSNGAFLGLIYYTAQGPSYVSPIKRAPEYFDPKRQLDSFGFSIGVDTLTSYLLDGTWSLFYIAFEESLLRFGANNEITVLPWVDAGLTWTWGTYKTSSEWEERVRNDPDIPPSLKTNLSSEIFASGVFILQFIAGPSFFYSKGRFDIGFSAGVHFMAIVPGELLLTTASGQSVGLVIKLSCAF